MATTFIGLTLPTVSVTIGPTWASQLNTALETIDAHDHTSGKGVQIPTAGLNIDDSLDFNNYAITNLLKLGITSSSTTKTGASNANSVYVTSGNLYFTNASGSAVQITDGGSVVTSAGALSTVEVQSVSSDITISPSDAFVFLTVNTSSARQITLPLASSVSSGRVYIIKDVTGSANSNNITLARQGSDTIDGATSYVLDSNLGSWWVVGDGSSAWHIA